MKVEILPSLLEGTRSGFLRRYKTLGRHVKRAHLDVLDGSFLPERDFHDPRFIAGLKPRLGLEVHLMTDRVGEQLPRWNYPFVKTLIFHLEAAGDPRGLIRRIRWMKKKAGISLSPQTPAKKILPLLKFLDTVHVMTVHPGKSGGRFLPATLKKIRIIRAKSRRINLEADGGLNLKTAPAGIAAGANVLVVGSFLNNAGFGRRLQSLKKLVT